MLIETLLPPADDPLALPAPVLLELTELYASDKEFQQLSGDFPDPEHIRPEQVAASLAEELSHPDAEVLLARSRGRLVGLAATLRHHPSRPDDPDPWIGLLMIDGRARRQGHGRRLTRAVEDRFREEGRTGVRLAVLRGNATAMAFWTALGYEVVDERPDLRRGRPTYVLRKDLLGEPGAGGQAGGVGSEEDGAEAAGGAQPGRGAGPGEGTVPGRGAGPDEGTVPGRGAGPGEGPVPEG
ncbi:Acetyltransferase (GNAT) family protein [Streptomyces sp. TverLS-915]|uniref:GNAT family N-acetyltransferase n=1 Tax=Streptomyces sp. TverLS-915 TaxID=1839763 RepID=UPI00081D894D|nr:GNAT family N-acetyltransferase [Streptomyces sp. TverLS-915]SCD30308.1 Acetyltransferase (GNAT) family protein [Streptomyces sp. TverLS-915]